MFFVDVVAMMKYATINDLTIGGIAYPKLKEIRYNVDYSPQYCQRCRRRQTYIECSRCTALLCAMCSWTVSVPPPGRNGVVDERCRECAEKA